MPREIKLDGGEITLLKTIGLGGQPVTGLMLLDRIGKDIIEGEFLDTLGGLLSLDYVVSSKVNVRRMEDVEHSVFRVNPAHAKDLKEAINPTRGRELRRARRDRRG